MHDLVKTSRSEIVLCLPSLDGNNIASELHFDLCFGGRRQFCGNDYADLGEYTFLDCFLALQHSDVVFNPSI